MAAVKGRHRRHRRRWRPLAWQVLKQVIEPSSAIALAAVLAQPQRFAGRRVGVILSGGNVDLEALPWQR